MLRWTTSKEYKHSKLFLDKPNSNRAKKILQLPRLKMKRLVEIITGHNNLSYFQYKVDPFADSAKKRTKLFTTS